MKTSIAKRIGACVLVCAFCTAAAALAGCTSTSESSTPTYNDVISQDKIATPDMEGEVRAFEVTQSLARPDGDELASYEFCVASKNAGFAATDVIFNLDFVDAHGESVYQTTGIADTILPEQDTYVTGVAYIEGGSNDVAGVNVTCDMEGVLWAACSLSPEEIASMCSVTDVDVLDVSVEGTDAQDIVVSGNVSVDRAVYGNVDPEMTSALMANVVALLKDDSGNIVGAGYQNCIVYDLYSETQAAKEARASEGESADDAQQDTDTPSPFGIRIDNAPAYSSVDVVVYPIFRG